MIGSKSAERDFLSNRDIQAALKKILTNQYNLGATLAFQEMPFQETYGKLSDIVSRSADRIKT